MTQAAPTVDPRAPTAGARAVALRVRPSFVPIPALVVLMAAVQIAVPPSVFYDPAWLILIGNTVCVTGAGLVIAWIALANYRVTGRIQILMLGCGVLALGVGGALAALVRSLPDGANLNVTIYNSAALLGAGFHFVAAFLLITRTSHEVGFSRRNSWLLLGYAGSVLSIGLLAWASLGGLVPPFFVQGVGPTALRQAVLGAAGVLFAFSFVVFLGTFLRTRETFLYWYACALALTAISLTAFFVERSVGSPVGWVGRFSQYLGGVYFLVSLLTAARSARRRGTSLDAVLTASLSGAEEMFRALSENVPDVIRRFDRKLEHLYVNAAGQRLYGKPAGAVVGRRMDQVGVEAEQSRLWSERIEAVFRTGQAMEVEEDLRTPGGTRFYQSRCVPEYGPGGVANVLVVSRDLTEHRRAEEAVRQSEKRYRSLFDGMSEGFAVLEVATDASGRPVDARFLEVNPAFERLTGLGRDSVLGRTFTSVLPGEDPGWLERYGRVVLAGEPAQFESHVSTLGRTYEGFASRNAPGQFAVVFRDVTTRRAAETAIAEAKAAAEEANRQKDQFLAVLSHELRNPLAPIRNSVRILELAEPGSRAARRAQAVIDRQAAQLGRLVEDLLDVTRIERNKIRLRRRRVELNELVREAVEDRRSVFERTRVRLELRATGAPVLVDADASRLDQVVGNLLQNAAKFTAPGGSTRVDVLADRAENRAVVRVSDTGVGMAPAMLRRLFQPFAQADSSLDRPRGGLGLGLALVRRLVELHGGDVSGHSAGPGQGSEFVVRLPLAPEVEAAPAADRGGAAAISRRALVVDDNADSAESLRDLLELDGHEIAVARDGPEGVARARAWRPDVVFCDIGLPGMDGYQVARAIRADAALAGTFLVALSGYAMPSDLERAAEAGFDRHVAKPAELEVLRELLAALGKKRPPGGAAQT